MRTPATPELQHVAVLLDTQLASFTAPVTVIVGRPFSVTPTECSRCWPSRVAISHELSTISAVTRTSVASSSPVAQLPTKSHGVAQVDSTRYRARYALTHWNGPAKSTVEADTMSVVTAATHSFSPMSSLGNESTAPRSTDSLAVTLQTNVDAESGRPSGGADRMNNDSTIAEPSVMLTVSFARAISTVARPAHVPVRVTCTSNGAPHPLYSLLVWQQPPRSAGFSLPQNDT